MILKSLKNFRKWIFHPVKRLFTLRKDLSFLIQASGQQWISALLPEENAIWQKASHRAGHMLIVGGAGAGKTQTMIIFIIQDIWVSRAVLIIDPKGDNDIRNAVYFSYKKRSGDTKGILNLILHILNALFTSICSQIAPAPLKSLRKFVIVFPKKPQIQSSARWENHF